MLEEYEMPASVRNVYPPTEFVGKLHEWWLQKVYAVLHADCGISLSILKVTLIQLLEHISYA